MPDRATDQQELFDKVARLETEVTRLREERIPHVDRSSRRRDRRLTFAYVVVTAFVVGLASVGSASALDGSNTVFSDDIVNGAVSSGDLKDGGVGAVDVRDGSLAGVDVMDGSIAGVDVADGSIGTADVADGSIGTADVGAINGGDVTNGTIAGADVTDGSIGTADIANGTVRGEDLDLFDDGQCTGETIQGTAVVNADPGVPGYFQVYWLGYDHSCSGGSVYLARTGVGQYLIWFQNPSRLAVATPTEDGAVVSIENLEPGKFFVVARKLSDQSFVDADFTVLTY